MHMKKWITVHVLLSSIRPRFRYHKMQNLWSFQGASHLDLHQDSTIELLGGLVAPPSIQMNCTMTDGHCKLCLRHDTRPKTKRQNSMTGAPLIGLPPQQLHPHHANACGYECGKKMLNTTVLQVKVVGMRYSVYCNY